MPDRTPSNPLRARPLGPDRAKARSLLAGARKKFAAGAASIALAFGPVAADNVWDAFNEPVRPAGADVCLVEVQKADRMREESPEIAELYAREGEATDQGLPRITNEATDEACDGGAEDILEQLEEAEQ